MKALLMDVGNSRLKWGISENGEIRRTGQISHQKIREQGLHELVSKLPHAVDQVFVSNVAGASFATRLSGIIGMHCGREVHFAKTVHEACGVTNSYKQPRRMGVDRWVAMIGAWVEVKRACAVVDVGTAATIDVIDAGGVHLGGQIFPGVTLMAAALSSETSNIPRVRHRRIVPAAGMDMFGRNTTSAVECGALNAVVGAIDRVMVTLRANGHDPTLILTGGDASSILGLLAEAPLHRPHLVLYGLLHLLESRQ